MTMNVAAMITRGLNGTADAADYVFQRGGKMVVPAMLGAFGGWMAGIGPQMGAFQGAASGALVAFALRPMGNWVMEHKGMAEDQIHPNTANYIYVVGCISAYAVPIILTGAFGAFALTGLASHLPSSIAWVVAPSLRHDYSVIRGIITEVGPAAAQYWLMGLREHDPRKSKGF